MQSSEGLTGAGAHTPRMVHSPECWQEVLVPYHESFSTGGWSILMRTSYLDSLRAKDLKRKEQAGSCGGFHDRVFEVVHHDFIH